MAFDVYQIKFRYVVGEVPRSCTFWIRDVFTARPNPQFRAQQAVEAWRLHFATNWFFNLPSDGRETSVRAKRVNNGGGAYYKEFTHVVGNPLNPPAIVMGVQPMLHFFTYLGNVRRRWHIWYPGLFPFPERSNYVRLFQLGTLDVLAKRFLSNQNHAGATWRFGLWSRTLQVFGQARQAGCDAQMRRLPTARKTFPLPRNTF